MIDYQKGSEWRRWDLHIHTPGTLKNDQFSGTNDEEKWGKYYSAITDYMGDGSDPLRAIAVLGITDYYSIDNYKKVVADNRLPSCVQLVLPNVEMRLNLTGKESPINIHFLFDPCIVDQLDDRFFSKLEVTYDKPYCATRTGLIDLGKSIDPSLEDECAFKAGAEQFLLSLPNLQEIFSKDKDLKNHTLIFVSNKSGDGVSGYGRNNGQTAITKRSLYRFVDGIFSGTPSDIKYFLGEGADSVETVSSYYGDLMPCVHGSDAHCNEKIFEPDHKRYCWIKADPTFNGLRQILYEPKQRVMIQGVTPSAGLDYQVIEKVVIDDERFSREPIFFNEALTCIIGGRSTGKSFLLQNIARAVLGDSDEKVSDIPTGRKLKMKVYWGDGEISEAENGDSHHRVIYIPQSHLNRLAETEEENTEIDALIQSVLHQDQGVLESYNNMMFWSRGYGEEIDKKIYDIIQCYDYIKKLQIEISDIGTENGIRRELEKQYQARNRLIDTLNISQEDVSKYNEAVNVINTCQKKVQYLRKDLETLNTLDSVVIRRKIEGLFFSDLRSEVESAIDVVVQYANETWIKQREELKTSTNNKLQQLYQRLGEAKVIETSLHEQVEASESLKVLNDQIQHEEAKLREIEMRVNIIGEQKKLYDKLLSSIVLAPHCYQEKIVAYAKTIQEYHSEGNKLVFDLEINFRKEAFKQKTLEVVNQKTLKGSDIDLDEIINEFTSDNVRKIVEAIISEQIALKKGYSREEVLRSFLSNWFNLSYTVISEGDSISNMSPGKKALVLLQLLISLQESDCPILIDQPEDDMDNRSIYDELVSFIRERKLKRQIIVVTHNANIVVGCDSEEVIVANQGSEDAPNNHYRFEYRSGAIENNYPVSGTGILYRSGIQQHICDILEGGIKAFSLREKKYHQEGR